MTSDFSSHRTHRDRKATYVKTLESEVAKLRAKDSAHETYVLAYRSLIRGLKDLIKQYNIILPPDLASDPLLSSPEATVEIFALADQSQSIRAYFPDDYISNPTTAFISPPTTTTTATHTSFSSMPLHSGSTSSSDFLLTGLTISDAPSLNPSQGHSSQSGVSVSMPVTHPQGLGATQVGVEFVLALEQPCLGHHFAHSNDAEGSGHEMMLMSPIMSRSPALNASMDPRSGLPSGSKWTVPAVELEKLLEFSDRLSLDGEITPVEIWQRIRQHPNFGLLTRHGLSALQSTLVPKVTCYGYVPIWRNQDLTGDL